jgi:hypothetical protein
VLAFARKKWRFLPAKSAFLGENRGRTREKAGFRSALSFREMSDSKVLARVFLPTPRAKSYPAPPRPRPSPVSGAEIRAPARLSGHFLMVPDISSKGKTFHTF